MIVVIRAIGIEERERDDFFPEIYAQRARLDNCHVM